MPKSHFLPYNSFYLGEFYPEPTGVIPPISPPTISQQTCGDFYCLGDFILTKKASVIGQLEFYQNYYGKCQSSPIPLGKSVNINNIF